MDGMAKLMACLAFSVFESRHRSKKTVKCNIITN